MCHDLMNTTLCTDVYHLVTGVCPNVSGQQKIDELGLDKLTIPNCAGILISYIVIARLIAFLGIRFIKW